MSEPKTSKLSKVARLRKRLSESLGRLACKFAYLKIISSLNFHKKPVKNFNFFTALAKEDWSISRTRSQSRLHLSNYRKEQGLRLKGKAGFSEEFLDKLDSDVRTSGQDRGEECSKELNLGWERLRLSEGDLLRSSRDSEFQKLKVPSLIFYLFVGWLFKCCFKQGSGGADSGLGSDEAGHPDEITVDTNQVVLRRPKKSSSSSQVKQRPKSEAYLRPGTTRQAISELDVIVPSNLKPTESVRRSKRYSAFGVSPL